MSHVQLMGHARRVRAKHGSPDGGVWADTFGKLAALCASHFITEEAFVQMSIDHLGNGILSDKAVIIGYKLDPVAKVSSILIFTSGLLLFGSAQLT